MKPSQGFGMSLVSLQMGVVTQLLVLIGLLTSTVVITRMIVLGNVSPTDVMLECEKDASNPSCTGSRKSQITNHMFPYQEALEMSTTNNNIQGYILSAVEKRYDYASTVTKKFNITAQQFIPHSYKSQLVYDSLEKFQNSTKYHDKSLNLKMFSHRLAHTDMLYKFVSDQTAKLNTWRFFFEDDIELHPNVTADMAIEFLAKGLQLASGDGILYLGICGPARTNEREVLSEGIEAGRTSGLCTHAYGVTKWRAAGILSYLDKVIPPYHRDKQLGKMYFDLIMQGYGQQVTKAWVLGLNLKTPVPNVSNHYGLLFQDRQKYASFISAKDPPK